MPAPVRSLKVLQNWDCHACGECCKTYHALVTEDEAAAIESVWKNDPELQGLPPIVKDSKLRGLRLNTTSSDACVFLTEDNKCRIHSRQGVVAKPLACRLYPFTLNPVGDHWRIGLRYACPSVVANQGRPSDSRDAELAGYAAEYEASFGKSPDDAPTPRLDPGQPISWKELETVLVALDAILISEGPLEHRLRRIVALVRQCRKARFEKLAGERLREFLELMSQTVEQEIPEQPSEVPAPSWVGRVVFRQLLSIYLRKDTGPFPGIASKSRWIRIRAAWRFALGKGTVPRLHGLLPEVDFTHGEQPTGPLSGSSELLLTRYFRTKISSLQILGPTNFGRTFWQGLDSLLLIYPATLWLARLLRTSSRPHDEAIALALRLVDDHFGYNPLLGRSRTLWAEGTLAERDDISRLIAWYAR